MSKIPLSERINNINLIPGTVVLDYLNNVGSYQLRYITKKYYRKHYCIYSFRILIAYAIIIKI